MKGFDSRWADLPDYIIGITREIWEDRRPHTLHDYYTPDGAVRSPASVVVGNVDTVASTLATLAEFPDRTLLGEDVIWCDDGEDGYLSSHRILSTATHRHDGRYGKASGTRLTYRILADCAARDNRIYDEWLIRDQAAIVRQLGWTPDAYARDLIEREGGPEHCVKPLTPNNDAPARYTGRGNDNVWGLHYEAIVTRIMNADLAVIPEHYDRACQLELPGGVTAHGTAAADEFWIGLRAAFPSAVFSVDHVIGRTDSGEPPRAALRWSLWGRHDGWGRFGTPGGAEVYVLGLSHAEFGPRGLRREFVAIDDTAIWKQIILAGG